MLLGGTSRPGSVRSGAHGEAFERVHSRVHVCLILSGVRARVTRDTRNQVNDDDDHDGILLNEMRGKEETTHEQKRRRMNAKLSYILLQIYQMFLDIQ